MDYHTMGEFACLLIPCNLLLIFILTILLLKRYISGGKKKITCLIITILIIIVSITYSSFHKYYVEMEPYGGYFEYLVYGRMDSENNSTIRLDLPIPHDERIISNMAFYVILEDDSEVTHQYPYFQLPTRKPMNNATYSLIESPYGEVMHFETNVSFFIFAKFYDRDNEINPEISLSTQNGDCCYINKSSLNESDITLNIFYEHTWDIGWFLSFDEKRHYISISDEPYLVPDEINDFDEENRADNFHMDGVSLFEGWNKVNITQKQYIMWE